ncbi:MAG: HlyD family secretion protein [Acidobacteriota bacterium]
MLQDGNSMDREVKGRLGMAWKVSVLLLLIAVGAVAYLYPSLRDWMAADRSVELARLRLGEVTRGDLLRDVSVQGRVVAADHPTLVSPAQGVVSVLVKEGDRVRRLQVMARIQSPQIQNLLDQEKSTLLSLKSGLERLKIANRQADTENQQEIALRAVKLRASQRALERAQSLFKEGLGSFIDYQKARDDVEITNLELDQSRQKTRLAKETMDFEIQTRGLELRCQQLIVTEVVRKIAELEVISPVEGLVSRVVVKDKDTVQPNQARRALGASRLSIFLQHVVECETVAALGGRRRRARHRSGDEPAVFR